MVRNRFRGVFAAGLAVTLGVTGIAVLVTGSAATAAPHYTDPPSIQTGWSDSATPGQAYDDTNDNRTNLPLGTYVDAAGKPHTSRVYATFDLTQFAGKKPYAGTVYVRESDAADCGKRAIEIWRTKPVSSTPAWHAAPRPLAKLDEILTPEYCPTATISFDVGAAVLDAVAHRQKKVTFELRVPEAHEQDPTYARHLYWYSDVRLSVQYNSLPAIDNSRLYNGGKSCSPTQPGPTLGAYARYLEALPNDPDNEDSYSMDTEWALWPVDDPSARTVLTRQDAWAGRMTGATLATGTLTDATAYAWQVRVSDGTDTSAWSTTCYFTYDGARPSAPAVTSANFPAGEYNEGPNGELMEFTFDGHGDRDTAGFVYSWSDYGLPTCGEGDLGQIDCPDPFSRDNTVRADVPGGTATVKLNPPHYGAATLTVRAIDAAGNTTVAGSGYTTRVPWSRPTVTPSSYEVSWGDNVVLKLSPAPGVAGVTSYEVVFNRGEPQTVTAAADGTATFAFTTTDTSGDQIAVTSHSSNGFVSQTYSDSYSYDPAPGVTSAIYTQPLDGSAVGGAGVEGTFTFSPPPDLPDVTAYRYWFDENYDNRIEIPAGPGGRATITWAPTTPGYTTMLVLAVQPDGEEHWPANLHAFTVAG
ncbi:hypothetical protein [Winogradskya humida]|uniref:Ig-like domain-containing protein n=1 Tax=Winogradskya humida TaxID=113566 RepID=A0ABQ3ZF71_9ACTN|nr:hypothetical protein [Actinoplanes humidus]GIE17210.1 hypothetical protein Ahu01nite_003120 [Actinoplanes humidus]